MQVPISEIEVKNRIRKTLGDLGPLVESIRAHGLMNPIVINAKKELIAGHRRLESARQLGWKTIEAHIINPASETEKLEMEIDENLQRRNLSADELADGYTKIEKLKHPNFFRRIIIAIKAFFTRIFLRKKKLKRF